MQADAKYNQLYNKFTISKHNGHDGNKLAPVIVNFRKINSLLKDSTSSFIALSYEQIVQRAMPIQITMEEDGDENRRITLDFVETSNPELARSIFLSMKKLGYNEMIFYYFRRDRYPLRLISGANFLSIPDDRAFPPSVQEVLEEENENLKKRIEELEKELWNVRRHSSSDETDALKRKICRMEVELSEKDTLKRRTCDLEAELSRMQEISSEANFLKSRIHDLESELTVAKRQPSTDISSSPRNDVEKYSSEILRLNQQLALIHERREFYKTAFQAQTELTSKLECEIETLKNNAKNVENNEKLLKIYENGLQTQSEISKRLEGEIAMLRSNDKLAESNDRLVQTYENLTKSNEMLAESNRMLAESNQMLSQQNTVPEFRTKETKRKGIKRPRKSPARSNSNQSIDKEVAKPEEIHVRPTVAPSLSPRQFIPEHDLLKQFQQSTLPPIEASQYYEMDSDLESESEESDNTDDPDYEPPRPLKARKF